MKSLHFRSKFQALAVVSIYQRNQKRNTCIHFNAFQIYEFRYRNQTSRIKSIFYLLLIQKLQQRGQGFNEF